MTRAVLATSLNPFADAANQRRVVTSWLDQGFAVISYNVAAESERLAAAYPEVEFRAPPRTAAASGKPLPLIGDILADLDRETADVRGLINADIYLRPGIGIAAKLAGRIDRSLVVLARTDVDSFESVAGGTLARGFDAMFFGAGFSRLLDDRPFCIGMPNWDYWLPLAALAADWRLAAITAPIALHIRHDAVWTDKTLAYNHHLMKYLLSPVFRDAAGPRAAFLDSATAADYDELVFHAMRDPTLDEMERFTAVEALAAFHDETFSAMLAALRERMPEFVPD